VTKFEFASKSFPVNAEDIIQFIAFCYSKGSCSIRSDAMPLRSSDLLRWLDTKLDFDEDTFAETVKSVDEKDGQLKHCSNLECAEPEIIY
jgi:hypothetical protein